MHSKIFDAWKEVRSSPSHVDNMCDSEYLQNFSVVGMDLAPQVQGLGNDFVGKIVEIKRVDRTTQEKVLAHEIVQVRKHVNFFAFDCEETVFQEKSIGFVWVGVSNDNAVPSQSRLNWLFGN